MSSDLRKILIIILLLLCMDTVTAKAYIIHSFKYDTFDQIALGFKDSGIYAEIQEITLNGESPDIEDLDCNICITLGEKALKEMLNTTSRIKIVAFMNYNEKILEPITDKRVFVVEPDIDLLTKIVILKGLISDLRGIVVPCTSDWFEKNHDDLANILEKKGIDLQFNVISGNIGTFFKNLTIPKGYLLMAVYDSRIYNRKNIYNILEITFKKRIPFVGLTKGFVRSGAYISVIPDFYAMGFEAAKQLRNETNTSMIPKEYNVVVNNNIMKMMDFSLKKSQRIQFLR